jgi:LysR family transcriptional regulator for metE and metH
MHLEVRHLKLVAAVAEAGGITKAGDRLHLTQSALSHQLRDIEEKLGTHLFLRLNKKMILTQAGERLLRSAHVVLDELKRAEEDVRQIGLDREGVLRISTECNTCYHWLPSIFKPFNQKFPRVEVRIVVEATTRPMQALLEGKLDLAIIHARVRNRKLLVKPLFKDEMVVIMRPDHRLAPRPYIKAEDFIDEHLLVYAIPKEENLVFQKVLLPAGVAPKNVSQVQLTEAITEMVKAGLGISVMAKWAVAPQIESGILRAVPLTKNGFYRQWSAAMIRNQSAPAYLLEFVKLLANNSTPKITAPESVQIDKHRTAAA